MRDYQEKPVHELSHFFNCNSHLDKEQIEALAAEHKTIQQNITRFCLDWIRYIGTDYDLSRADGRNIDSVTKCHEIMDTPGVKEIFDNGGIPFI